MKLLIITQKVDLRDNNLGFFHGWIKEFAKHVSEVKVIASYVGEMDLPPNVQVFSLGKELHKGRIKRWWGFRCLFIRHYGQSDAVFFHMIPEFVLAAAPFLVFSKKTKALWYTHKSITWKLKLAEKLVDRIFTASRLSFRLPSKKVVFAGHAIDTDFFKPETDPKRKNNSIKIITAGRISPSKNYETIIQACSFLKNKGINFTYSIVGAPVMPKDQEYLSHLQKLVDKLDLRTQIGFTGPIPYPAMPAIYNQHDIFISTSSTGSIDKVVLEAISCGLATMTSNEAFREILPDKYFLPDKDPKTIFEKILELASESRPNNLLRSLVINNHSLSRTIHSICALLS